MADPIPIRRGFSRIVIGREGLTRRWRGRGHGGHAMITNVARFKDNTSIERKGKTLLHSALLLDPKVECAHPTARPKQGSDIKED